MHNLKLTDEEIVAIPWKHLPSRVQGDYQDAEDRILMVEAYNITPQQATVALEIVRQAESDGRLSGENVLSGYCAGCGRMSEQFQKRRGSLKWHTRYFQAVEFADDGVRVRNRTRKGACVECVEAITPALIEGLKHVDVAIRSKAWRETLKGGKQFVRHDCVECSVCGWTGHEGQMRRLPAMMRGTYPGGCPECDAENSPLGKRLIGKVDGHVVIPRGGK